mmetsp:Transcript_26653/g.37563  ORF Transcript_26653/g.37563 Transcript_26653/m.37563 type:complete len:86 (-) Transcript_26653:264-521(-)
MLERPEDASERFETHKLIFGVADTVFDNIDEGVAIVSLLADGEAGVIGARAGGGVALYAGGDSARRPDKPRLSFSMSIEQVIQFK